MKVTKNRKTIASYAAKKSFVNQLEIHDNIEEVYFTPVSFNKVR
jgi:hypothetical protein